MSNILAIDTSGQHLSVALLAQGKTFSTLENVGNKQSHYLIKTIDSLLTSAGIEAQAIDLIAYVEGPGSFTGLRVGLSVALGISLGSSAKLIAIPTFALYAKASEYSGDVVVGIDARLGQLYLAGINAKTLDYFMMPEVVNPEHVEVIKPCKLIGDGFNVYKDQLNHILTNYELLNDAYPNAKYMLDIVALDKYPQVSAADANLAYIRNKVALTLDEQRQQKMINN